MLGLMQLGGLLVMIAMTCGPVVGLLGLLNRRDRRESAMLGSVFKQFASPDFRGRIAAHVRCALFSRRSVVEVNALACSREEIWDAIARLSRTLPTRVRLVIRAMGDPEFPAALTVETPLGHRTPVQARAAAERKVACSWTSRKPGRPCSPGGEISGETISSGCGKY